MQQMCTELFCPPYDSVQSGKKKSLFLCFVHHNQSILYPRILLCPVNFYNNTAARTNPIWISFFGGGAPQAERGDAVDSAVYALCTEHARCNYVRDAADAWRQKLPNYSAS